LYRLGFDQAKQANSKEEFDLLVEDDEVLN